MFKELPVNKPTKMVEWMTSFGRKYRQKLSTIDMPRFFDMQALDDSKKPFAEVENKSSIIRNKGI